MKTTTLDDKLNQMNQTIIRQSELMAQHEILNRLKNDLVDLEDANRDNFNLMIQTYMDVTLNYCKELEQKIETIKKEIIK